MGNDITPGHVYSDTDGGREVNVDNLNRHVSDAVLKETAISLRSLKATPALSDQLLITDGALKKVTLEGIKGIFLPNGFLSADTDGRALMADGFVNAAKLADSLDLSGKTSVLLPPSTVHSLTEVTELDDADEFLIWDSVSLALRRIA